jgi:hypothetical protein
MFVAHNNKHMMFFGIMFFIILLFYTNFCGDIMLILYLCFREETTRNPFDVNMNKLTHQPPLLPTPSAHAGAQTHMSLQVVL